MSSTPINCSFCGRAKEEVDVLIAGVTGHICDNCIEQADNILQEERKDTPERADFQLRQVTSCEGHKHQYGHQYLAMSGLYRYQWQSQRFVYKFFTLNKS